MGSAVNIISVAMGRFNVAHACFNTYSRTMHV